MSDLRKDSTGAQPQAKPEAWQNLHSKFNQLAEQENKNAYAIGSYEQSPRKGAVYLRKASETGRWMVHGVSEAFRAEFYDFAVDAGKAHGCPKDADAKDFWLHKLYFYLWENKSKEHLRVFDRSRRGRAIVRVCEASAMFCTWLKRQAPAKSEAAKKALPVAPFDGLKAKKTDLSNYLNSPALTEQQRTCLSLKLEYELGVTKIGRRMNIHHSTVQEHIDAGEKALKGEQNQERRKKRRAIDPSSQDEL